MKNKFKPEIIGSINNKEVNTKPLKLSSNYKFTSLNNLSKFGLLLTLAGYNCADKILIYEKTIKTTINLNKFANMNLNFKNRSPKLFDITVQFKDIDNDNNNYKDKKIIPEFNNYEGVLLLSGGIESSAGLLKIIEKKEKILPIWVNFGQRNSSSEEKVITKIGKKLNIPILIFHIDLSGIIYKNWEAWGNGIIPARNFMLLSFASLALEKMNDDKLKVYLCAARGEINKKHNDKSPRFYKETTAILSNAIGKNIIVTTPFYKNNKTEIIKIWESDWSSKYSIHPSEVTTCWIGNNCGICSACTYRRISFAAAGVVDHKYLSDPLSRDEAYIIRNYYLPNFKNWGIMRKVDFIIALEQNRSILSKDIKAFFDRKYLEFASNIRERKREIKNY